LRAEDIAVKGEEVQSCDIFPFKTDKAESLGDGTAICGR